MTEETKPQETAIAEDSPLEMQEEFVSELEDAPEDEQISEEDRFLRLVDADEEEVGVAKADLDPKDDKTGTGVKDPE